MTRDKGSFTFTVGKLDAGMAILIGSRAHLIEFPSILLPPGTTTGGIVNISVHRNTAEEEASKERFWNLQNDIYTTYGIERPTAPNLELRNVTQTSVTLTWPLLDLATATLLSLDIYRNNTRLARIPNPLENTSTKLSGLSINTPYTFQLILRTTAGSFPSNIVTTRTHTIEDTRGVSVCFGTVDDPNLLEEAKHALREMGGKWSERIEIDTTHFVCTTPAAIPAAREAYGGRGPTHLASEPGVEYQRAMQLSIPIITPLWVLACHREKKMAPIGKYYLGATPEGPLSPTSFNGGGGSANSNGMSASSPNRSSVQQVAQHARQPSQPQPQSPPIHTGDVNPIPAPVSNPSSPPLRTSSFFNQVPGRPQGETSLSRSSDAETIARIEPLPASLPSDQEDEEDSPTTRARKTAESRKHTGKMRKDFKFPPPPPRDGDSPDIELPEEDRDDVPGTPVTPRTPRTAPPAPPPPMIVVHAAKDSMNPTPPPKRVDLPEVVLPDPPTPNSDGEQTPPGGRVVRLGRRESEDDLGETVEVDLS